jgi:glycosyltransferase involved in cell wall biosynthesis
VSERFHLVGSLSFTEVVEEMSRADVMVHGGVIAPDGRTEGFGSVLIEAGAMGLPTVSVRLGGIPEAVVDGTTGLLADSGDLNGLAERILVLARKPEVRMKLGRNALERTRSHFGCATAVRRLEELYDRICAERRAGK